MIAKTVSPCIITENVSESRDFYVKFFNAEITFDCGWYVNLKLGNDSASLQFMSPQNPSQPVCNSAGLIYNFAVEDVDEEYEKLTKAGLTPSMPLGDHPWGDRGFSVSDPSGITLYIYSEREPSEEFAKYYSN